MPEIKVGPLTREEITLLWKSVTDPVYHRPLLEQPDSGVEGVEQAHAQFARASEMVDRTTQAMFIFPWSGQSDEPAGGPALARVTITATRDLQMQQPLTLQAGIVVLHVVDDYGKEGAVEVVTSRRYLFEDDLVFGVGEVGPKTVDALSERPGFNYNLPLDGTLKRLEQPGSGLYNTNATQLAIAGANWLELDVTTDVLTHFQIGQYIWLTLGPNVGQRRRIIDWAEVAGDARVNLAPTSIADVSSFSGPFIPGEDVTQGGTTHTFVSLSNNKLVTEAQGSAEFVPGVVTGAVSGDTATIVVVEQAAFLTPSPGPPDTSWQVLDWSVSFGIVVTNDASPSGGRSAMLDELGGERGIGRTPGEEDDPYRERVGRPADTVSPRALRRAANAVLSPIGSAVCLREVGTRLLPGFYYDAGSSADSPQVPANNYAYDMNPSVRPEDRFKVYLNYTEFRAFFMIGVPPIGVGAADVNRAVFNEIDRVRAGGVGFEMYEENIGCF